MVMIVCLENVKVEGIEGVCRASSGM